MLSSELSHRRSCAFLHQRACPLLSALLGSLVFHRFRGMGQVMSQRKELETHEVPAISSSCASATRHLAGSPEQAQRKCPPLATSAYCSSRGPPAPGLCTHSDLPLSPATPAHPSHMAFVWDPRGASVPALSTRVKSRSRFSKSYRYCSFLFVAGMNFFHQPPSP